MGKTDTIRDRRVDVYVDSIERKERWAEQADAADTSLSKFVQQCVEYAIERGGPDFGELGARSQKLQELEEELKELQKDIDQKEIVIEKLETDLRRERVAPFQEPEFEGIRAYDRELIDVLQRAEYISGHELREQLAIDPTDQELMKGFDRQLQQLESYGLVKNTGRGWRWTG